MAIRGSAPAAWLVRLISMTGLTLAVVAQLCALVHIVAVNHVVCAEHGVIEELGHGRAASVSAVANGVIDINAGDVRVDDDSHDHCVAAGRVTTSSPTLAPVECPACRAALAMAIVRPAPSAVAHRTIALLAMAPKTSPPSDLIS